jgi:hypothetical protein
VKEHPLVLPVLALFFGGFCLYLTVFTHTLRDWVLSSKSAPDNIEVFDQGLSCWSIIAAVLMFISIIFLSIHWIPSVFRRFTRKPRICPRCRAAEGGKVRFPFSTVAGTGWDSVRCPNCGHEWYAKS